MTQKVEQKERVFSTLYFTQQEKNGVKVAGKFKPLKIRFLYQDIEQIPMGRVHLFNYMSGKYTKVLCLKDGKSRKELETTKCPMCDVDKFGTPSSKLHAFVQDLEDDGKLKLFEMSWTLSKQIDAMAELKGLPLHDMVFYISKQGSGKETTYTPMFDGVDKFDVAKYMKSLGLTDYPQLVGAPADRAPIMALSAEQMSEFIAGNFPWSNNEGGDNPKRKFTSLSSTVTIHGGSNQNEVAQTLSDNSFEEEEEVDVIEDIEEDTSSSKWF